MADDWEDPWYAPPRRFIDVETPVGNETPTTASASGVQLIGGGGHVETVGLDLEAAHGAASVIPVSTAKHQDHEVAHHEHAAPESHGAVVGVTRGVVWEKPKLLVRAAGYELTWLSVLNLMQCRLCESSFLCDAA